MKKILTNHWFYIIVLSLIAIVSVLGAISIGIMIDVGNNYHPIGPENSFDETMIKFYHGLAIISVLIIIIILIQKYRFKSIKPKQIIIAAIISLLIWTTYLSVTYKPDNSTYDRIYAGQKYSVPWDHISGTLTRRGNSPAQWSQINSIGFYHCNTIVSEQCEWSDVAVRETNEVEFASWDAQINEVKQPITLFKDLKKNGVEATQDLKNIADFTAFKNPKNTDDNEYYLFSNNSNEAAYHWAYCREKMDNGTKIEGEYYCQHYVRQADEEWSFQLRMKDTANYQKYLIEIKDQLKSYKYDG